MTQIRAKRVDIANASDLNSDHVEQPFSKTPSWFTQLPLETLYTKDDAVRSYSPPPAIETPDAAAYEAYKKRMEQRFNDGQDVYDQQKANFRAVPMNGPKQRRPTLPLHEIQGRKKLYKLEQQEQKAVRRNSKSSAGAWTKILALGTAAICIGAVAGLGFSNSALVKQKYSALVVAVQDKIDSLSNTPRVEAPKIAVASNESVITKKPISTATLDVSDVRGTLGGMIPLALTAQSADASEPISLKITGLPDKAYLTAGIKSLEGNWTLKASEIGDAKLVVPVSDVKQFEMEVSAVDELTGALAAPTKAVNVQLQNPLPQSAEIPLTQAGDGKVNSEIAATTLPAPLAPAAIVSPVSAAPDTAVEQSNQPSPIPKSLNEADDFVAKGNALLDTGDIIAARQFFTKAAEMGNPQGSFGVARSYDPKVFARLNVVGLQPDEKMAADWYKKAAEAGVVASTQ